ncbi:MULTISPECIES: Cof-type HAD-IIB family hydrolase [Anaerofustis]|uniref:Cof-type HAD-IIB family hydrolase n=1 Tax=Anaerofustis TaxID=264995 RepID=UPI001105BB35|nr:MULTISPECIES: Cof-type HAD-IIB family hydrolase [Anaerofustis]MCO8193917.1 Cof-type HAD-IIB family hydrolase [Anaerofustis sp. NSJ-163]
MDYKLLITDLDGTMLNSKSEISERNLKAVHELQRRGKFISVGSGRLYVDAIKYARQLGCQYNYNIANAGLTIFKEGEEEYVAHFEEGYYKRIVDILRYNHIPFVVMTSDYEGSFYDETSEEFVHRCRELNQGTLIDFIEADVRDLKNVYKISSSYRNVDDIFLHREVERLNRQIRADISGEYFIDLSPRGISKWTGAIRLAKEMGISTKEIIAVGDQENDMQIVANVGLGVAMKNAVDSLKKVADVVLPYTNDEDGVAYLIEKYML